MEKSYIHRNFELYHKYDAARAVEYKEVSFDELLVKLEDGRWILYDDSEKTVRTVRVDDITEEQCQRDFGHRLRKLMCLRGITQVELSDKTGIPQPLISKYINGVVTPSFYKVVQITKALGCSLEDLRYTV